MPAPRERARLIIELSVYILLAWVAMSVAGWAAVALGGYLVGITVAVLSAAIFINWLMLSIYEHRPLADIGLHLRRASSDNLLFGLAGGMGAAVLAIVPGLLTGSAKLVPTPNDVPTTGTFLFIALFLAIGAAGEEILFRGYAFQILIANAGTWTTVLPVAAIFALMHAGNPNATVLALANTAGFGVVFGYAYLRSHDLWLPIGLHYGWNVTLPLLGVNVSGLKMKMTGYEIRWTASQVWSGGEYGPEGSILASLAMIALVFYLWKAPIRIQPSPLLDPPAEPQPCEPIPPSPL